MSRSLKFVLLAAAMAGCASEDSLAPQASIADPAGGRLAFERECARCHASADGFDLAFFGYSDTTIVRRAVAHVDTATALDIVAHVRTLGPPQAPEGLHLFQPGGSVLGSDVEFAVALFGSDNWPTGLTTSGLRAMDPRHVRIALPLPIWSDESSNLDWMPDHPLPAAILDYAGHQPEAAVAAYRAAPSEENLRRAVQSLRTADRAAANQGAPCLLEDSTRARYLECFEVRRWTSSLVAQHLLRRGTTTGISPDLHDVWWEVGNAARKSRTDPAQTVPNAVENWATWMFLSWSFDPSRHPSVYNGGSFRLLGLVRHATFIALRSEVARPAGSPMPYDDLLPAVRFSPSHWTMAAATFGLTHLLERQAAGDRPLRPEESAEAMATVNAAVVEASRKIPVADRPTIAGLGQAVITGLRQP